MKKTNPLRRCRLCACEEQSNNFFYIFDTDPELELQMKITKLLPVVVIPWDSMSHLVCHRCKEKLNSFNEFYDTSLRADNLLRTLNPSTSESERGNDDSVTEPLDNGPSTSYAPLKLPPKKRRGLSRCASRGNRNGSSSANAQEIPQSSQTPDRNEDRIYSSNHFMVTQITERDSFFTCRLCWRTSMTPFSALTHSCVRIENYRETTAVNLRDESRRSLPPLKIRLFSMNSGLYVCFLCQTSYEDKERLLEHLKEHFLDGNTENKNEKKGKKGKGKRKLRSKSEEDDEDWEKAYKKRPIKRRRKSNAGPQKKGKAKPRGKSQNLQNKKRLKGRQDPSSSATMPPANETMETTTQHSNITNEESLAVLNSPTEENAVTIKTETKYFPERSLEEFMPESLENNNEVSEDLTEMPEMLENDDRSDEVTVLEVVDHKKSTTFSSCSFCDKIFAAKEALIVHQNKHLEGYSKMKSESVEKKAIIPMEEDGFLCSICAMMLPDESALLEHEQYHLVDLQETGFQKKIRIALGREFRNREVEQSCQISKEEGVITITVTARGKGKKTPRVKFI